MNHQHRPAFALLCAIYPRILRFSCRSGVFIAEVESGDRRSSAMTDRYITNRAIQAAVKGREPDILRVLGIDWQAGKPHIRCPYRSHADENQAGAGTSKRCALSARARSRSRFLTSSWR